MKNLIIFYILLITPTSANRELNITDDVYIALISVMNKLKDIENSIENLKEVQSITSQFRKLDTSTECIKDLNDNIKKINNLINVYNKMAENMNSQNKMLNKIEDNALRKVYKPIQIIYIWNLISFAVIIIIFLLILYLGCRK